MRRDLLGSRDAVRIERRRRRRESFFGLLVAFAVPIFILIFAVGGFVLSRSTRQTITATVTDKAVRLEKSSGEDKKPKDKYMIYAKDVSGKTYVFENTDTIYYFKFDSSDVYAEIEVGKTYDFDVYGWRLKLFSSYQNIIKVQEVN